jgi:hypothetical protein
MAEPDEETAKDAGDAGGGEAGEAPSDDELRAQLEEEIKKVRVEDVVLQSVVSILNLAARRLAKEDERDLDQAKVGIDAARALVDLVKPEAQPQLRQAVSELQLLYSKHAGEGGAATGEESGEAEPQGGDEGKKGEEGDSPLWTPGS